jgi:dimethylglycine dehydrogenase
MDAKNIDIGMCDALVQRVSYTGDLGYEIYVDADKQRALYNTLVEAGKDLSLRPFGMRAMMSLRLDRFFGSWNSEFSPDYTAAETGLDRFISYNKPADFIGKAAATAEKSAGPARQLCAFEVDVEDADVHAYEPISINGKVVGFCTSGGYSHHAQKSIAQGFVPTEMITDELEVEIEILGKMCRAKRLTQHLFDPEMKQMRG